ncbi:MAG: hypothetical protein ACOYBQ_10235 [Fluviibacter sp.]
MFVRTIPWPGFNTLGGYSGAEIFNWLRVAGFIDANGNPLNPIEIYNAAVKFGVTAPELDAALNWAPGTAQSWIATSGRASLTGVEFGATVTQPAAAPRIPSMECQAGDLVPFDAREASDQMCGSYASVAAPVIRADGAKVCRYKDSIAAGLQSGLVRRQTAPIATSGPAPAPAKPNASPVTVTTVSPAPSINTAPPASSAMPVNTSSGNINSPIQPPSTQSPIAYDNYQTPVTVPGADLSTVTGLSQKTLLLIGGGLLAVLALRK